MCFLQAMCYNCNPEILKKMKCLKMEEERLDLRIKNEEQMAEYIRSSQPC